MNQGHVHSSRWIKRGYERRRTDDTLKHEDSIITIKKKILVEFIEPTHAYTQHDHH